MTDVSSARTRSPLSEATHRINASYGPSGQDPKARYVEANTQAYNYNYSVASQPDIRVTAPLASNPPAVMRTPKESDDSKRLSQASCDSTSSGRSKKNYKTHIGPWQLGKTLGKGSSARVRLCRHNITNQLAAVKIVNRRMAYLVQDSSMAALSKWDSSLPEQADGEMRVPMAIEREVAILKLIEHPHIMKLYDIWENRSEIYLILEFIDHGDLFTFINSRGRLTEEVTVYFFRQMMSAITYCHSFNICHRDLKPENILISADLQIKIADFGMAALHQTDTHQLATACGSPHYAAPELLKNRQYKGDRADIWSLGVILYAMLAAYLPFDDPDLRVMMNKTKKGHYEMPKGLSPEAEDLIRRMLQVNPDRRITLREIWRHPLVQKYSYLDNYGDNNGQPPDIRKGFQYTPVPRQDIDPQLLRQLRSMWHMFSEQDLALKLTCEEPNDQKAFYWLLFNYRNKQLEDFKPELSPSMSDYHHLKPASWKKRVSTRKFSQPRSGGHGRSVSRFTVISNAAENETEGAQGYDPYRESRAQQPDDSQNGHTKVTVHRDQAGSQSTRRRSNSNPRRGRSTSVSSNTGRSPSRGSMMSLRSNRHGTPRARPSLRHKRGVDFSHVRKKSGGSSTPARQGSTRRSPSQLLVNQAAREEISRSESPEPQRQANGNYPKAKGAPARVVNKDSSTLFMEELRHFSSNIAKDCDEAFGSSLIEDDSVGGGRQRGESPLAFNLGASSGPAPKAAAPTPKPWDLRPLPGLPSDRTLYSPSVDAMEDVAYDMDDDHVPVEQVARLAVTVSVGDRRVVSAPVPTQSRRRLAGLPSITEDKAVNVVSNGDKARIVSAPPNTPPKNKDDGQAEGMEYLTRVENSIRVVESPSAAAASRSLMPKLNNLRKKPSSALANGEGPISRQTSTSEHEYGGSYKGSSNDSQNSTMKRKAWFKRISKATVDSQGSHDQTTLVGSEGEGEAEEGGEAAHHGDGGGSSSSSGGEGTHSSETTAPRKKAFNFPFFKGKNLASSDGKFTSLGAGGGGKTAGKPAWAGGEQPQKPGSSSLEMRKMLYRKKTSSSASGTRPGNELSASDSSRNIEVKQSWLARLFRVKPATEHLCMTMSRKKARKQVAKLLREGRRYGIRDVQVDKDRNIVFARVGAPNYLNLKEVSFAAEIMTVIEHGKKQPLSIVRFTQERGAASSFHSVVATMRLVFDSRGVLVNDRNKEKMMMKTLNS